MKTKSTSRIETSLIKAVGCNRTEELTRFNKSIWPYLKTYEKNQFDSGVGYYDLKYNAPVLSVVANLFESTMVRGGSLVFVGGKFFMYKILRHTPLSVVQPRYFSMETAFKFKNDIIILQEQNRSKVKETQIQKAPFVGVSCLDSRDIPYLINLNLDAKVSSCWYLLFVANVVRRSLIKKTKAPFLCRESIKKAWHISEKAFIKVAPKILTSRAKYSNVGTTKGLYKKKKTFRFSKALRRRRFAIVQFRATKI